MILQNSLEEYLISFHMEIIMPSERETIDYFEHILTLIHFRLYEIEEFLLEPESTPETSENDSSSEEEERPI